MHEYDWTDYFSDQPSSQGWLIGQEYLDKTDGELLSALKLMLEDDLDCDDVFWAIENTIDPEVLDYFASHQDEDMRYAVTLNHNTPPEILSRLANDTYDFVICNVALHPKTPLSLRNHLNSKADLPLAFRTFEYPEGKVYVYPDGDLWRYGDIHWRSEHAYVNIMCARANGYLDLKAKIAKKAEKDKVI